MKKSKKNMTKWIQEIAKKQDIHTEIENKDDADIIRYSFRLDNALSNVNVAIVIDNANGSIFAYSFVDANAGKHKNEVGELLMRLNCNDAGAFWLDFDTGEISYHIHAPINSFENDEDLTSFLYISATHFDYWGDAIMKVILGCISPKDAIDEVVKEDETDKSEEK